MRRVRVKVYFFFVIVALFFYRAAGQSEIDPPQQWNNGIGHSSWDVALEPNDRKKMLSLWDSIGEDLKTEKNELAGTFVKGGYNSGFFLRWSVAKGFVIVPYFDQNLITDFGFGTVAILDQSEVIFEPEKDLAGGRGLDKMPRKWTVILGYFAPVESLKDLGAYRAGLGRYNAFNGHCCEFAPIFLCHRIDRENMPLAHTIPAKYAKFIKTPITGEITKVGKRMKVKNWGYQSELYGEWMEKAALTPVRINIGKRRGIKRKMLLRMVGEPEYAGRYVQVMKVALRSSQGYVVHDLSFGGREDTYRDYATEQEKALPPIRVGIKVTSSPVVD